jgi:hypothetical protein
VPEARAEIVEREAWKVQAWIVLVLGVIGAFVVVALFVIAQPWSIVLGVIGVIKLLLTIPGYILNQPNMARTLTFFGRYIGTVREDGWWWVNPLTLRRRVSLRIHNLDSDVLKVYDDYEEGEASLRANADEVTETLQRDLQDRLVVAGLQILDTRLRRLAYAPEIAGEMLRRQQANAVVAARQRIVVGAVGMVEHALELLSERQVVELDEERKAAMVSNLLVVLCSDRGAQPVVNSGSLYQ